MNMDQECSRCNGAGTFHLATENLLYEEHVVEFCSCPAGREALARISYQGQ